ncbi:MAG: hypothetical protein QOG43_2054 [Actinomycetota bacterium]|jgi:hypothetical protein|nr:hypothetical protein [Actinomycetota bacterium]
MKSDPKVRPLDPRKRSTRTHPRLGAASGTAVAVLLLLPPWVVAAVVVPLALACSIAIIRRPTLATRALRFLGDLLIGSMDE